MKTIQALIFCILCIVLDSCQKAEPEPLPGEKSTGSLCLGVNMQVTEHDPGLKSSPEIEDFSVQIFRENGTPLLNYENASDIPDTISLEIGNYYVEANSENDLPAAFENPYFFGSSGLFSISTRSTQTVQVVCSLANCLVSVEYSENVRNSFTDYSTTISSGSEHLVFTRNELRRGYFRPAPLSIQAELHYPTTRGTDTSKVLNGAIPEPSAGKHYEILIDAVVDAGMAQFLISLDSSTIAETVEINGDQGGPVAGELSFGDLLITEIMYDPSSLTDTEGEWLEVFNNSGDVINLRGLIIERDDLNTYTIADSIVLLPGEYHVLEKTAQSTGADGYVYGSGILLPNSGAVLSIFNSDNGSGPGSLVFTVDYGAAGFPDGSGTSICLDPGHLNAAGAALGINWCISTSLYSSGDLGTPGSVNDPCN